MKKLLSILAAVGLTATASTSVVACSNISAKGAVVDENGNVIDTTDEIIMPQTFAVVGGTKIGTAYGVFDKNGKQISKDSTNITPVAATETLQQDKAYKFVVTFNIPKTDVHKKNTYYFGTIGNNGIMGRKLQTIKPRFESSAQQNARPVVNHVVKTQKFEAASVSATFATIPTPDQLAKDFAITDSKGDVIKGVKYAFVPKTTVNSNVQNNALVLDATVAGKVSIKIPSTSSDSNKASAITVDTTAAGKTQVHGFTKQSVPTKVFTERAVNVDTSKLAIKNDMPKVSLKDFISNMDEDTAKDVYEALINKDAAPSEGTTYKEALANNSNALNWIAAKGMSINPDTVNGAFNALNGTMVSNNDVLPDGSQYEIGFTKKSGEASLYYWFDMSFDRVVNGKVTISGLSIKDDTLTAQLGNDGQFIGKDINQFGLLKVMLDGKQLGATDIKSSMIDDNGLLTVKLNKTTITGETAKISVANVNNQWTDSETAVNGTPSVSNLSVVTAKEIDARVINDDYSIGQDLSSEVNLVVGTTNKKDSIKSAILGQNGQLKVLLKDGHQLLTGEKVTLSVNDNTGKKHDNAQTALFGNPDVSTTVIKDNGSTVEVGIVDNQWLGTQDILKDDLLEFWMSGRGTVDNSEIKSAVMNSDGTLLTIKLNSPISKGAAVKAAVKNSLGNLSDWSDQAVYGQPTVSNVQVSDSKTITAQVSDDAAVIANDNMLNKVKVFINGEDKTSWVEEATTNVSGKVTIKLDSDIARGSKVSVEVADANGDFTTYSDKSSAIYGMPRVADISIKNSTTITAQIWDNYAALGQNLLSAKKSKIHISIDNGNPSDSDFNSAIVNEDGLLTVTLKDSLKEGQFVSLAVDDAFGNAEYSAPKIYGTPNIDGLSVAGANKATATITANDAVKGMSDLLASHSIKASINGGEFGTDDIKSASVSNDGKLDLTLNNSLSKGDYLLVSIKDAEGNWSLSNVAAYEKATLSNVSINSGNDTITATVQNYNFMDGRDGTDLLSAGLVTIKSNNSGWNTSLIKSATINNGTLTMKLKSALSDGDSYAIGLKNVGTDKLPWTTTQLFHIGVSTVTDNKFTSPTSLEATINKDSLIKDGNILNKGQIQISVNGDNNWSTNNIASASVNNGKLKISLGNALNDEDTVSIRVASRSKSGWTAASNTSKYFAPSLGSMNANVGGWNISATAKLTDVYGITAEDLKSANDIQVKVGTDDWTNKLTSATLSADGTLNISIEGQKTHGHSHSGPNTITIKIKTNGVWTNSVSANY